MGLPLGSTGMRSGKAYINAAVEINWSQDPIPMVVSCPWVGFPGELLSRS